MNSIRPNAWPYRDYVIRALNNASDAKSYTISILAKEHLKLFHTTSKDPI